MKRTTSKAIITISIIIGFLLAFLMDQEKVNFLAEQLMPLTPLMFIIALFSLVAILILSKSSKNELQFRNKGTLEKLFLNAVFSTLFLVSIRIILTI